VTAEALVHPVRVPELAPALLPVIVQMREAMVASGSVTADDIDDVIGTLHDGDRPLSTYSPILVSARGRR
jgi:hypothetical protein